MIKFFRKIRQNLLLEGKTGKYLKYAIGEIVLVMIGILLALQVNNWNEERKITNTIESLFKVFENELENNIRESNSLISRGYYIDSITSRYINNKITREDLLKDPDMFLRFSTLTRNFKDDNLDALIELEKELPIKYVALLPELKLLKERIESQRKWEKAVIEISMTRKKELADELPTVYLTDSISIEKNIKYFLTDSIFKNKVIHYNEYDLIENTWDASLIRTSVVALLWKIKTMRGHAVGTIDEFLKNVGLRPFQELSCGAFPVETVQGTNFRLNYILYNSSDKEVFFNVLDTEGKILNPREFSLAPKSFGLGEFTLSENGLIQVLENGTCKDIFRRLKQDYIVIN
jgi:hypothetical protein